MITRSQSTPLAEEAYLGDNKYVGSWIHSFPDDPTVASVTASTTVPAANPNYTKARITVECRTSVATNYSIQLKNWQSGLYEVVKTGSLGTADTKLEQTITSSNYVHATSGQMQAFIHFEQPDQINFYTYLDKIEFGAR